MVQWRLYRTVFVVFDVNIVGEFWNGAEARGAVSSVDVRHVRIAMSRELKKERANYDVIGR